MSVVPGGSCRGRAVLTTQQPLHHHFHQQNLIPDSSNEVVPEVLIGHDTADLELMLLQLEEFQKKELQLFDQLKRFIKNQNGIGAKTQSMLGEEMKEIIKKKKKALSSLLDTVPREEVSPLPSLSIAQPTPEVAVANRYLVPPPTVMLNRSSCDLTRGPLIVSVRLFYHGMEDEVVKTLDGRQDVLQGVKKVSIDANGRAVFNKLKIMEVSSKHKHQAFCLVFSLEEHSTMGIKILSEIKSNPFHVQSRPNKRKLSECSSGEPLLKRSRSQEGLKSPSSLSPFASEEERSPSQLTIYSEEENLSEDSISEQGTEVEKDKSLLVNDYNYIDITDLLILPQKEAARRLGISESMLCKRFKECTRRKWPYRYLRKIDKVINMLNLHKSDGVIPKEDRDKLEKLTRERDECLRPVKIRITACDKLSAFSKTPESPESEEAEDEIPDDVLETLEMMKAQKDKF